MGHTQLYRLLEDGISRVHLETKTDGKYCNVCKFLDKRDFCTIENVAKCPAVTAQLNMVEMLMQGIDPLDPEDWLREDV